MVKLSLFLFISCLCLFSIKNVVGFNIDGTCEILNPQSQCASLYYNVVYIPPNKTQEMIEAEITSVSFAIEFATDACKPHLSLLFCLSKFGKCNTINDTTPVINLPSYPCFSSCEETLTICIEFFEAFNDSLGFSCYSKDGDGNFEYPVNSTKYDLTPWGGSSSQDVFCDDGGDSKINTTNGCPGELVYVPESKRKDQMYYFVNSECAIPCPFKVYTEQQYTNMRTTKIITYALSFGSSVYLIFVFGILPNKITNRMEIILSFSIGGFLVSLAYYMEFAGTKEYDDFICSDEPGRYIFETDPSCGFNGAFFHFGLLTSVIWWSMICYDFYLTMNIKRNDYFKYLRIVGWGVPLVCTVAPLIGVKFGASIGSSGCWLTAGNKTAWPYLTFYAPIWTAIIASFYFMFISIKKILQTYRLVPNRKVVLFNIRTIGFMLYVMFAIVFGCFNNFYLDSKSSLFLQQIYDYFFCLTENEDGSVCSVQFPFGTFRLLNILATSTTGIAGFLGLGLDPIVMDLWSESTKINYLVQVIKNTSFYGYLMLKGTNNNSTVSTNSSSFGNTGTNLTSTFSNLSQENTKPLKKNRKTVVIEMDTIKSEFIVVDNYNNNNNNNNVILVDDKNTINSIDNPNNDVVNSTGRIVSVIYEKPPVLDYDNDNNNNNPKELVSLTGRPISVIYEKPPTLVDDNNNNNNNNDNNNDNNQDESNENEDQSNDQNQLNNNTNDDGGIVNLSGYVIPVIYEKPPPNDN